MDGTGKRMFVCAPQSFQGLLLVSSGQVDGLSHRTSVRL